MQEVGCYNQLAITKIAPIELLFLNFNYTLLGLTIYINI